MKPNRTHEQWTKNRSSGTTKDGRPALKFGQSDRAYPYTPGDKASRERARAKAAKQGRAIKRKK